jgi:hypothetical protein
MRLRAKALLCATTCLAAILTGATFAQAEDQTSKNGCNSPQAYEGSITSPAFSSATSETPPQIEFQGWFEIESIAPGSFDTMTVEYSLDTNPGAWFPFGDLTDPGQVQPNTTSGPDLPYSNNGTSAPPSFQTFAFELPPEALDQTVQVRIRFATVDQTYQGFRGLAVDNVNISAESTNQTETFENGPGAWTFEAASGPGAPFWQVLNNPQNVSVASPLINPDLVTLPDSGALPPAFGGQAVAWFGNVASGTFCGPDFGNRFQFPAAETVITSAPPASTTSSDASFSFVSTDGSSNFECRLDGAAFTPCVSPQSYSGLARSMHNFEVRAIGLNGSPDPTPATHAWSVRAATLEDLANPVQGVAVNVQEVSGTVLVGLTGAAARAARRDGSVRSSQKGVSFVPLSEARQVPVGSFLDTRRGTVRLQSATDRAGTRQTGTFLKSLFQVRQSRQLRTKGLTDLVLKGSSFNRCRTVGRGKGATAAADRRTIRRLRANAKGRFRTRGRNSSATVRGTIWDIADRCDGTLTRVSRGRVVVRDFRRKRNIVLRSGKSYLARAPR